MKKLGLLLAIALMLGACAFAQNVGDSSVYFVTYFSNANTAGAPDSTLRVINDGDKATSAPEGVENGSLWEDIYVFDDSQELISCCSCYVSSDGLTSESVNKQLTSNTFTGRGELSRGVIKVISSSNNNPATPAPTTGIRGWMTHVQATSVTLTAGNTEATASKGPFFVTETALSDSNLSATEVANLGNLCSFGLTIGSGYGQCPCTVEDYDF